MGQYGFLQNQTGIAAELLVQSKQLDWHVLLRVTRLNGTRERHPQEVMVHKVVDTVVALERQVQMCHQAGANHLVPLPRPAEVARWLLLWTPRKL